MTRYIVVITFVLSATLSSGFAQTTKATRVLVFLENGSATGGYLSKISEQGIFLLTVTGEEWIPLGEIKRVIVRGRNRSSQGLGYGLLLGGYLGGYVLSKAAYENETSAFIPRPTWLVIALGILPGAAVGGGLGYLFDPGGDSEDEIVDFGTTDESRRNGVKRLQTANGGSKPLPKIHLTVQGSQVMPNVIDDAEYDSYRDLTNFNWLRRLEISYSFTDEIEVGLAKIWFSEPRRSKNEYTNLDQNISESRSYDARYDASGFFLVGHYSPDLGGSQNKIGVSLGLGLGTSDVTYSRIGYYSRYNSATSESMFGNFSNSFSEQMITGVVMGDVNMRIHDGIAVGLSVDHVLAPKRTIEGDAAAKLSPKELNLGNTSIGFSIRMNF